MLARSLPAALAQQPRGRGRGRRQREHRRDRRACRAARRAAAAAGAAAQLRERDQRGDRDGPPATPCCCSTPTASSSRGSWQRRCRDWPSRESARSRPKLLRAAADGAALGQIDAAGMFVDRRRKNGLVGHGRPAGGVRHARARRSAPTGPPRCISARRSRTARCADGRCSTRTWGCGRRMPTSRGGRRLLGWRCVIRAARARPSRPQLQPDDTRAAERGRPPPAVPQPVSDDRQERDRRRTRSRTGR